MSNGQFAGAVDLTGTAFDGPFGAENTQFEKDLFCGECVFSAAAQFHNTQFSSGNHSFARAKFKGMARFVGATFHVLADFAEVEFQGFTFFDHCKFLTFANFSSATFSGMSHFRHAWFADHAYFAEVKFTSAALFDYSMGDHLDFRDCCFETDRIGPWVARSVTLRGATFESRVRLHVRTFKLDGQGLTAQSGMHLLVQGEVDLTDAEFLRPSIISPANKKVLPLHTPDTPVWGAVDRAKVALSRSLAIRLNFERDEQPTVTSFQRATTKDLSLYHTNLSRCRFFGAHGLDALRIDASCTFGRPPSWRRHTLRPLSSRRMLFEEYEWRREHTAAWSKADMGLPTDADEGQKLRPLEVVAVYRALRKGLEDAKDEPGAADFYYGEMEMRRLAGRDKLVPPHLRPPTAERLLLNLYWLVSGYGLRAWRAFAALGLVLAVVSILFTSPQVARLPVPPERAVSVDLETGQLHYAPAIASGGVAADRPVPLETAFSFALRDSLSLLRAPTPTLQLTGLGTAIDVFLRLAAPLLLGFAVLALRGRTKR